MPVFTKKKFRGSADANTIASRYRVALKGHPFLLFGLPFIATMVAGSFFLTPATAIRYEKHDRRVRRLSKEEELGIGKAGRRVDMKEEYYVSPLSRDTASPMLISYRNLPRRILTTGSRSGSRDFQESTMESYNWQRKYIVPVTSFLVSVPPCSISKVQLFYTISNLTDRNILPLGESRTQRHRKGLPWTSTPGRITRGRSIQTTVICRCAMD